MTLRYIKTDLGRGEIARRNLKLPRRSRTLLLIIDSSRPASDWLALVHGGTEEDLEALRVQGLIAAVHDDAADAMPRARSLEEAIATLSYEQLYELLTSQGRDRLGLIKGFKFVLEVERCSGIDELRALTVKFVGMVRTVQGEDAAQRMYQALGATA